MNRLAVLLIFFGISIILGCAIKEETVRKGHTSSSIKAIYAMSSDTIPDPKPPPPPPGLAPGQAKVKGKVIETDKQNGHLLQLNVEEVLGYGASTPPIAVSDTLSIQYVESFRDEIRIGKIVSAVLSYRHQLEESGNSPLWMLVRFDEEPN